MNNRKHLLFNALHQIWIEIEKQNVYNTIKGTYCLQVIQNRNTTYNLSYLKQIYSKSTVPDHNWKYIVCMLLIALNKLICSKYHISIQVSIMHGKYVRLGYEETFITIMYKIQKIAL